MLQHSSPLVSLPLASLQLLSLSLAVAVSVALPPLAQADEAQPDEAQADDAAPSSLTTSLSQQAAFIIPGFTPSADPKLRIDAQAVAWYMAPGGELRLPRASGGTSTTLDIDPFGFDTPQLTPMPEVNIFAPANPSADNWFSRRGWRIGGRAFVFGDDNRTTANFAAQLGERAISVGQQLRTSLDYASAELEAGVNLHSYASDNLSSSGAPAVSSTLEAILGLQAIDCSWRVTIDDALLQPAQEASATSFGAMAGGKLAFAFGDRFLVDVTITAAAGLLGDEMFAADVVVGGTYFFSQNFGVQVGYRSAFFSLTGDEPGTAFEYSGSHQGLLFGATLRF